MSSVLPARSFENQLGDMPFPNETRVWRVPRNTIDRPRPQVRASVSEARTCDPRARGTIGCGHPMVLSCVTLLVRSLPPVDRGVESKWMARFGTPPVTSPGR